MLYNGVELPDINEVWTDKTAYPYAIITSFDAALVGYSGSSTIYLLDASGVAHYNNNGVCYKNPPYLSCSWFCSYDPDVCSYLSGMGLPITVGEWGGSSPSDIGSGSAQSVVGTVFWSNADILNTDGSVYLAASDPVPVGNPHITTSSGDGFALYNGVKLPALPNYDKSKYPYCFIGYNEEYTEFIIVASDRPLIKRGESDSGGMNAEVFGANEGVFNHAAYSLIHDEKHAEELGVPAANEWLFAGYIPDTVERKVYGAVIWSNYDILNADGSLYLAASDPIPLDGMTVIEWDGDTTGLSTGVSDPFYFNVSSFFSANNPSCVVINNNDILTTIPDLVADGAPYYDWKVADRTYRYAYATDSGVYFLNSGNMYTSLFAYRSVESPPEDDGGDTSTALKHYCRVNGSVHEVEGGTARVNGSYHEIEVGTVRIEGAYYEIGFDGSIGGDSGGGDEGGGSFDGVIFQPGEGLLQGTVTATPNNPSFTSLISYSVTDSYITTKGGNVQQTVGGNTVYIPAFYILTIGLFDATDFDTLHVELTSNIGVVKCESGTDSVASGVITNSATAEEVTLDISGLSGDCNVVIAPSGNITSSTIFNATIYKIWLT